jgi:7,8-dihydropterin-6-yl-methyl-4-(beta-D-ribofuranosyl)aminobenzene 5'-phosphate synthase
MGRRIRIVTVADNVPLVGAMTCEWGFAAVIEADSKRVLFDTGASGPALLANLAAAGFSPDEIDALVISHDHSDHTGGLVDFLAARTSSRPLPLYPPEGFDEAPVRGANVDIVYACKREEIVPGVHSTGTLGRTRIPEQSLVVLTGDGPAVVTGCAHPGIDRIVAVAAEAFGEPLALVMGGFHLFRSDAEGRQEIITALDQFDIRRLAPSHCTGDDAVEEIARLYERIFVRAGNGFIYESGVTT